MDIIGGSGFIGTRLTRRLTSHGYEPRILDIQPSGHFSSLRVDADVTDLESLTSSISSEVVINLAAEHRDDVTPKSLYDVVNVQGARNICEAAERHGVTKIIFTSSVAVYGFAPKGTDENGDFNPFNDYGRTKLAAESVFKEWQAKDPLHRSLVIIRPTVVFGEANRGNVYNLLRQIASGKFLMIGAGTNVKSMAYVENIAAFIEHTLSFGPGVHIYNYVDKPDFDMNTLVTTVYRVLNKKTNNFRLPFFVGMAIGKCFDVLSLVTGRKFSVSSIRVKKFCSDSMFNTSVSQSGFQAPVPLQEALVRTVHYEFVSDNKDKQVFFTE